MCHEHFKEPKVLPCCHYYCKKCVADLIGRAPKGKPFNCPECRREVQAVDNVPESFPTAFFVNRMREVYSVMKKAEPKEEVKCENCSKRPSVAFCQHCCEYICESCVRAHKEVRQFTSHVMVSTDSFCTNVSKNEASSLPMVAHELKCTKHKDELLKLYCHTCCKLICQDCIVIDHQRHKYAFVVDAAPQCKSTIKEKAISLQGVSFHLKSALKSLTDSKKKLLDHSAATINAIDAAHLKIVSKLEQQRMKLKTEASRRVNVSTEEITAQEKSAQLAMGEVESLLEFFHHSLEKATDQELLSLQQQMCDQADRRAQLYAYPSAMLPVPQLPQLEVQCSDDILQLLQDDFALYVKHKDVSIETIEQRAETIDMLCKKKKDLENKIKQLKKNKEEMNMWHEECSKAVLKELQSF